MEPREVFILREGEAKRWSRTAHLVAWAVWQIVVSIPFAGREKQGGNVFMNWMQQNRPPGFIPPNRERRG